MANTNRAGDRATKWTRWVARGIGLLAGAFWLISLIAELISAHTAPSWEGEIPAGLVITTVLGVLVAWRREGIGGTIVVIGAIALATFSCVTARFNKVWIMLITDGPFLVANILFLMCSRRAKSLQA